MLALLVITFLSIVTTEFLKHYFTVLVELVDDASRQVQPHAKTGCSR